jgi:hypothetical protein
MRMVPARLISADSHVSLTQEKIKAHVPSYVHDGYGARAHTLGKRRPSVEALVAEPGRDGNLP